MATTNNTANTSPKAAQWRYDHAGPGRTTPTQFRNATALAVVASLLITLYATKNVEIWALFIGLVIALGALIQLFRRERLLQLGSRYLQCGLTLVYYANVDAVEITDGRLVLRSADRALLTLERSKFPTNARKPPKIAANQQKKFDRVCALLKKQVLAANPQAKVLHNGAAP